MNSAKPFATSPPPSSTSRLISSGDRRTKADTEHHCLARQADAFVTTEELAAARAQRMTAENSRAKVRQGRRYGIIQRVFSRVRYTHPFIETLLPHRQQKTALFNKHMHAHCRISALNFAGNPIKHQRIDSKCDAPRNVVRRRVLLGDESIEFFATLVLTANHQCFFALRLVGL